jgi:hypothetical protein
MSHRADIESLGKLVTRAAGFVGKMLKRDNARERRSGTDRRMGQLKRATSNHSGPTRRTKGKRGMT